MYEEVVVGKGDLEEVERYSTEEGTVIIERAKDGTRYWRRMGERLRRSIHDATPPPTPRKAPGLQDCGLPTGRLR